jgi:hypothetical protein
VLTPSTKLAVWLDTYSANFFIILELGGAYVVRGAWLLERVAHKLYLKRYLLGKKLRASTIYRGGRHIWEFKGPLASSCGALSPWPKFKSMHYYTQHGLVPGVALQVMQCQNN